MLPSDAQVVSVDDHVVEHPLVWSDRLGGKIPGKRTPYRRT